VLPPAMSVSTKVKHTEKRQQRLVELFDQLRSVTDEIEALTQQQVVDPASAPESVVVAPSSPAALRRRRSAMRVKVETEGGADEKPKSKRPTHYPHRPEARADELEKHRFDELELLDALKIESFEGFYNLSFILLMFALLYNAVRNVWERGVHLDLHDFTCAGVVRDVSTLVALQFSAYCVSFFGYALVKMHCVWRAATFHAFVLSYVLCQVLMLVGSVLVVWSIPMAPGFAAANMMVVMVLMLKAHSYVATNYALFREVDPGDKLDHISLYDYFYFLLAPTLVYETEFPRTEGPIRWNYVAKKLSQMAVALSLQYCLLAQFMLPVLRHPTSSVLYDLLKLVVPSFLLWLAGFYAIFHCYLNALAELLHFADRCFFEQWWSATSLDLFWRRWNIPVHEWCLRHIYVESMYYYKVTKVVATFGVFLFSAVLHEIISSVAFRVVRPWFFFGMLVQIPLIHLSRRFRGRRRGNMIVWLSLFMGQPLLEILYFREWFATHDSFFCV